MPSIISAIPKAQDDNTMGIIKMLVPGDFSLWWSVAAMITHTQCRLHCVQ